VWLQIGGQTVENTFVHLEQVAMFHCPFVCDNISSSIIFLRSQNDVQIIWTLPFVNFFAQNGTSTCCVKRWENVAFSFTPEYVINDLWCKKINVQNSCWKSP
jgi:hypothetical protein